MSCESVIAAPAPGDALAAAAGAPAAVGVASMAIVVDRVASGAVGVRPQAVSAGCPFSPCTAAAAVPLSPRNVNKIDDRRLF